MTPTITRQPTAPSAAPETQPEVRAYLDTLSTMEGLSPQLLDLIREAASLGARLTIVTIHPAAQTVATAPSGTSRTGDGAPLTVSEVAAHYRVEGATIRAWCREGRFRGAERRGKSWRIPRAALQESRPTRSDAASPSTPLSEMVEGHEALESQVERHVVGSDTQAPYPDPSPAARATAQDRSARHHKAKPTDHGFDRATLGSWRNAR
jgi:excisionase family DNA binding protein